MRRLSSIGLVVFAVLGAFGCNEAQPTVNRVQVGAMSKKAFEGDWYYLQTVIDSPYSAGFTFVGEQGSLEKITWEIQEEFLIARRTYEHIIGSEPEGIAGQTEANAPVAVYKIESHFDIRRDYNPVTGEEQNVVSENDTDRPWYQRDYIRVDWSENVAPATDMFAIARILDGIKATPVAYYVQEFGQDHPHAPKFVNAEGGKGGLEYMDIVNKVFIEPQSVYIDGFGSIPSCYLYYQDHLDCASAEVTVRNSFLRVDESRDYEPFKYSGDHMNRAGYFLTTRGGYDKDYGVVDPLRHRFANRHNIWQKSHVVGDDGKFKTCFNDDSCDKAGGSTCDLDLGLAKNLKSDTGQSYGVCTIPYREREIRKIAYHVTANFPEDLWPDAQHLVDEWNKAFVGTVSSLRENECLGAGLDAGTCANERSREDHQSIYVLCHNPVAEGDDAACGEAGTSAQIGDLRHSIIGWVNEPHLYSPLGYGPSAADPETGEIIQANAFVYGAAMETLAAMARDTIALLNGDLDQADFTSGQYIRDWVESQKAPGSEFTGRPKDDHAIKIDGTDVERINEAMDFSWAAARGLSRNGTLPKPTSPTEVVERVRASIRALGDNGAFGNGTGAGYAKLQALRGTDLEKMLMTPEMMLLAGVDPNDPPPVDESILEKASPIRRMNPTGVRALQKLRDKMHEHACILDADFADDGLLGLARAIQKAASEGQGTFEWYGQSYEIAQGGKLDYDKVRDMLRHPIFDAVTAHEVGHTLGLRHNFSGSFDAWNYLPGYWQLRNDGNMQPRYLDAMTQAEVDGRIREYQYSTVMDYGSNFVVTDSNGIGHYDHAAIKLGYGNLVEVFDGLSPSQAQTITGVGYINQLGWPIALDVFSQDPKAYAYTDYPGLVGGIEGLERRADVSFDALVANTAVGIYDPVMDPTGRPVVPYLFCSDEQADLGPDCQRYDAGADAYEAVQSVIDNYYNYYLFNAFGRGRVGFNPDSYFSRILGRYFNEIQSANQYGLYRSAFTDGWDIGAFDPFWTSPQGFGAWTAAVGASYQVLTQVISTPEPGAYSQVTRPDGSQAFTANYSGTLTVNEFDGRSLETTWDFDQGYYWRDQVDRVGFFLDKVGAVITLVDPTTYFVGRDTSADVRKYALSFYTDFPGPLTSYLRAMQGEEWSTIAPRAKDTGDLAFPDALSQVRRDTPGVPIDPNTSFSIQLYAQLFSLWLIPDTYDERYVHSARIFVKGSPNGVDLEAGTPTVEFVDPETGLVYVAASKVVDAKETGVGAQMVNYANSLKARGQTETLRQFVGNLDLAHRLGWSFTFGGW